MTSEVEVPPLTGLIHFFPAREGLNALVSVYAACLRFDQLTHLILQIIRQITIPDIYFFLFHHKNIHCGTH